MTSLLLHTGNIQPKYISEHILTKSELQLDIYNLAKQKGLLHYHFNQHLQQFLISGFRQLIQGLDKLESFVINGKIFSIGNDTNPPDFNYKSQFLRITLLKVLSYCMPPEQRSMFNKPDIHLLIHHTEEYMAVYKRIFKLLTFLNAPDVIMWWFFQVPTYQDNICNNANYCITLNKLLVELYDLITDTNKFNQPMLDTRVNINALKCFQICSRGSTYYYNICYNGKSNKEIIYNFNRFVDTIYPDLKYISPRCRKYYLHDKNIYGIDDFKIKNLLELWDKEQQSTIALQEINLLNSLSQNSDSSLQIKEVSRIKIIFITNKLNNYTSVFRDRIGIIFNLDRRYFDVYIGLFTSIKNPQHKHNLITKLHNVNVINKYLDYFIKSNKIIYLDNTLLQYNQSELEKQQFHIIFYPDIGMIQSQTLLAHSRLSPIQCVTWGHSATSGLGRDVMDYYITSQYFENMEDMDIIKSNYTEKPILLPSLGSFYYSPRKIVDTYFKPSFEQFALNKEQMGFPRNSYVIGCLQSFYKFNEEFEHTICKILDRCEQIPDLNGNIYLAMCNSFPFNKLHLARLEKYLGKYKLRIKWFQNLAPPEWLNLISICHIMLDPFPFGGCNTTLEAFDYGIPVICKPSNVINGRFTYGFIKKISETLNDTDNLVSSCLIAESTDEYVNLAVRLLQDKTRYRYVSNMILEGKSGLFEDGDSLRDYQKMFIDLVKKHMCN